MFKTLDDTSITTNGDKLFDISDDEFANEDLLTQADLATSDNGQDDVETETRSVKNDQNSNSGENPINNTLPNDIEMTNDSQKALNDAKAKITLALEVAKKVNNPEMHLETALHELNEDTTMLTTMTNEQQLAHQVEALKFLCNSMIRNAKLATKMTRIVNTNQVTKAVNKTMLMEDLNPTHLSLQQFLQHPISAEIWTLASHHDSDFEKHKAWGIWWMGIVEDQAPRQRLRRTIQHAKMFNHLAMTTFTDFGHNPTKFSTEWLVIQLVRLGDHLLAANLKSEYGFNWPTAYQKIAGYIARTKLVNVAEIFSKIEPLWPTGIRMNFHYNQPAFNDCVLQFAESDTNVGKIPEMKKMKHKHDLIFGGPNVAERFQDSDASVNNFDDRECDEPQNYHIPTRPTFPIRKKPRIQQPVESLSDDPETWHPLEPRKPMSYADIFK